MGNKFCCKKNYQNDSNEVMVRMDPNNRVSCVVLESPISQQPPTSNAGFANLGLVSGDMGLGYITGNRSE